MNSVEPPPVPEVTQPRPSAGLLWRTVRHLRGEQVTGQLQRRVSRALEWPAVLAPPERSGFPGCRWTSRVELLEPGGAPFDPGALRAGRFSFLGQTRELGFPPCWDEPSASHLWRYNLHYFEWLWALEWNEARVACLDWIARHPIGRRRVGWEPYAVSLRLQNWLAYFFLRHRDRTLADAGLADALWQSAARQARWLCLRIEKHIAGNHVLENAVALFLVGSCFDGAEPQAWEQAGSLLLGREVREQFLSDGVHYERSPSYHVRLLYALTLVLAVGSPEVRELVLPVVALGLRVLGHVVHPDGEVAQIGDSARRLQPRPSALAEFAGRVGVPPPGNPSAGPFALPEAGFYGFHGEGGDYLVVDAGPVGPDHQPGHSHADFGTFELSVGGRRLVVDTGVGSYQDARIRAYARATAAHNTLEIAGQNQAEMWGAFRVGRRYVPRVPAWEPAPASARLVVEHDGYAHLPGSPVHRRSVRWWLGESVEGEGRGRLEITDQLTGGAGTEAEPAVVRLLFEPGLDLVRDGVGWSVVERGGEGVLARLSCRAAGGEPWPAQQVVTVPVFPEFGVVRGSRALVIEGVGADPVRVELAW